MFFSNENKCEKIGYANHMKWVYTHGGLVQIFVQNPFATFQEFQAIYRKVFPNGDPTRFAGFVFNVFDKDLDGTISFVEFLMALSITSRGNMDEKLDCKLISYGSLIHSVAMVTRCSFI